MTSDKPSASNVLSVWHLGDPCTPVLVGKVSLVATGRGMVFSYDKAWVASGYPLSGDMPLQLSPIIPSDASKGLGAMNDAMPDRWGERAIRYLDKPGRITDLDLLYLAGDGRFGSLGFSQSLEKYIPHDTGPLPELASIELLQDLILRIENNEPLTEAEKSIARSTKTMGGAHPKALVCDGDREFIAKFPRGSNVDIAMIEHASMVLAASAGIRASSTRPFKTSFGHIVLIERFDREGGKRNHCLSAKTALLNGVTPNVYPIGELSYPAMADFIRQFSKPGEQLEFSREMFRRMVFNILIENSDDHEKNHAFIFKDGFWSPSPAFDVLPLMANSGRQEMGVGIRGDEPTLSNALSQCERFRLSREEAFNEWFDVAGKVSQWKQVFADVGVSAGDIAYLSDFIDSEDRVNMRDRSLNTDQLVTSKSKSVKIKD